MKRHKRKTIKPYDSDKERDRIVKNLLKKDKNSSTFSGTTQEPQDVITPVMSTSSQARRKIIWTRKEIAWGFNIGDKNIPVKYIEVEKLIEIIEKNSFYIQKGVKNKFIDVGVLLRELGIE